MNSILRPESKEIHGAEFRIMYRDASVGVLREN